MQVISFITRPHPAPNQNGCQGNLLEFELEGRTNSSRVLRCRIDAAAKNFVVRPSWSSWTLDLRTAA